MAHSTTTRQFDETVLQSTVPTLVDFWAPWCGPCQQLGPIVDRIAEQSDGSYHVVKVNVDDESELAERYGILSIPTLIVFENGEPVKRLTGLQPEGAILDALSQGAAK